VSLNELRTDMQAQFNKSTRHMEASRKRRIMRRYGFVYTSADPSQEELDSEAAETTETTGMEPPAEQQEELESPNQPDRDSFSRHSFALDL